MLIVIGLSDCSIGFKSIFLGGILLLMASPLVAQKKPQSHTDSLFDKLERTDLIDFLVYVLKLGDHGNVNRTSKTGDILFSVIPVAPASSGDGKVAISAINASFYLGQETNISSIYFYPYTNFNGSYGVTLTPNIWLDQNRWNAVGDFRFIHNGSPEYGLGANTSKSNPVNIQYEQARIYLTGQTRIVRYLYLGAGYNLDLFYSVNEVVNPEQPPSDFSTYPYGTGSNTTSSGVTLNLLRDNRRNSINPTNGFYTAAIFRVNKKAMGSTYDWGSIYLDTRKYISMSSKRHKVYAFRAMYWGSYGDVPYFNLPSTFQDIAGRAGRGYSNNRFRGKQMIFGEAEYRFDISRRGFFGGVVFANAQTFTEPTNEKFNYVQPAAGVGLRLKFNRNSDTNLCLDFAYGRDGFNFYVNLGEYF